MKTIKYLLFILFCCYTTLSYSQVESALNDNILSPDSIAKVVKTIRRVFTAEKYDLIERAAQVVSDAILDEYPDIFKVEITLKKPEAPIKADFDYVGVTITRER